MLLQKSFHQIVHRKFQGPQTFRIDDAIISSLMIECSYAPKLPIKICTVKRFAELYYNKFKKQGVLKYFIFICSYVHTFCRDVASSKKMGGPVVTWRA